jgi:signal transduction histidine kinase
VFNALITPRGQWSLRRRVYVVATAAIVGAWSCGGLAIFSAAQREYEAMCEGNLRNLAETVLGFASHEIREVIADGGENSADRVHLETVATLNQRYSYQIWSRNGKLLLRSARAPADRPLGKMGVSGYSEVELRDRAYDVFVLIEPRSDMEIHVADSEDGSVVASNGLVSALGLAFFISLLPVLGLTWLLMHRAFDAFTATARQIHQRSPLDTRPLAVSNPPRELAPLIVAINRFVGLAGQELARQRSFTAMAAHELRTPLASVRVQAQVLSRAEIGRDRERSVGALFKSVDRCARLVTQLLTLARVDSMAKGGATRAPVRLSTAFADVLADFADEAERRGVAITCELQVPEIDADMVGLQALLRNLVSNALRHTPDSGTIHVETRRDADGVLLTVEDSGDGIPQSEYARVFERFYRRAGEAGSGVGLGLAIVAGIVESHGATIKLGTAGRGGLRVEVRFPAGAATMMSSSYPEAPFAPRVSNV